VTVLRLEPVGGTAIDGALSVVDAATLARRAGGAYMEVAVADAPRLVRRLAFAGIAATPCDADLIAPDGLIPALGVDLAPLSETMGLDLVWIRRLGLGEATMEILRPRFGGLLGPSDAARMRCRSVLHGTDVMLAWRRLAWATRSALRHARTSLRPVVFDREAMRRSDLDGRAFASEGAISRWLFA